jgi:hypothetical protein
VKRKTATRKRTRPRPRRKSPGRDARVTASSAAREVDAIRQQIERAASGRPARWNADPEDVRRSVVKLVLTLVELIRQILERQAIRRMENQTLTDEETENVGMALMQLQETIVDLAAQFEIDPEELNLDLGPLGRLM